MSTSPIVPCLWFDDQAERAAQFYTQLFPAGKIGATSRYPQAAENPSGQAPGSVMTVEFEIAGQRFTALNGGPMFEINPSISFFVYSDSVQETDRLFAALAEEGSVLMPLGTYPWSERYGWVRDRFGVSWQILMGPRERGAPMMVPCLMFTRSGHGRAEEAMRAYTTLFPGGGIDSIEHGRFHLGAQAMVAMDSPGPHEFGFSEALSLQVMCRDQAEVDRYWEKLGEGGEPSVCGWLEDRFGVSWQIVPDGIAGWMTSRDAAARDRAFRAMMEMTKPDIAALERAFAG